MFGLFRWLRRRGLRKRPVPPEWIAILERQVPFFRDLEGALRGTFLERLKIFVWEKHFEGAGGFEITDEARVVIAACAVRLTLHRDMGAYDRLTEIVVYPAAYKHPDRDGAILGEARHWGTVVLSWQAVLQGLRNPADGHDTAAHEFAHVLDRADGTFDGTPIMDRYAAYGPWAQVMTEHYDALREHDPEIRGVLRRYGATDAAEFFAVATESFFEKPDQLRKKTPELYEVLRKFYRVDPEVPIGGVRAEPRRNDPCPCGSGKKYKRCCGRR